ncbi:hypothetical protein [Thiohalophilus thiocyanatoxydans]|uniref:Methyltransferase family protein n=1 Tax=Thiohalophilus thiocyanatoxydans TaxID=381308 RepID=A0A4R8IP44_9GAMM|nr:hypothetical protein [Thiohalophilus thiocyanatoxydans]TDY02682.1 hypothetical protein EDC23_1059 [Thiohalophilus thiocyanatoxydans]
MVKKLLKILQFAFLFPKSFVNINLWARDELRKNRLTVLSDSAGSDKGTKKHLYTRIYDDLFDKEREKIKCILEIGLLCHSVQNIIGGNKFSSVPSLDMWSKYFPAANVYGFDDKDFTNAHGAWTKIYRGDQSNREDLAKISSSDGGFDVVIDDALHASYHQQVTFSFLFSELKPGGFYIIEDLHFQPSWVEELHPIGKTIDYLEKLRSTGVWDSPVATEDEKKLIENTVESIEFYDSMSQGLSGVRALAVIRKKL